MRTLHVLQHLEREGPGLFKKQFDELKNRFSQENLNKVWEKYKEDSSSEKKEK